MPAARSLAVRCQLGGDPNRRAVAGLGRAERRRNQREWKERAGYGRRWGVERYFSAKRRIFGDSASSIKWENVVREIRMKAAVYNRVLDVGAAAA